MPEILAMVGEHALAASDSSLAVIASARTDERLVCQASVGDQAVAAGREIWLQPAMAAILASGVAASVRRAADVFGPADADKMGPALVVPMDLDRLGHGILVLVRSDNAPPFMQEDVETSILFSSRMVLAVELVRERGLQQSLLLSEDRDKPPRDLHDLVIQRIYAAGLSLQSLRRVITDESSLQRVTAITDELDAAIHELRDTNYSLHKSGGAAETLGQRILRTIATVSADAILDPRIHLAGPFDDVDEAVAEHLVSVVPEGRSNVVRHSGAVSINITIDAGPNMVELVMIDDGVGFVIPSHGNGLANMRDRAALLGGRSSIESTPGRGTCLTWTVPHAQPAQPIHRDPAGL